MGNTIKVPAVSTAGITIYDSGKPVTWNEQTKAMLSIWIESPTFSAVLEKLADKNPAISRNRFLFDMGKLMVRHPIIFTKLQGKPDMSFAELKARAEAIMVWEEKTRPGLACPKDFTVVEGLKTGGKTANMGAIG